MIRYSYIKPRLNCKVKVFLRDGSGKHVKWDTKKLWDIYDDDRLDILATNKGFALELRDSYIESCRETLCNSISTFFNSARTPIDSAVTLEPPRSRTGKPIISLTSELIFHIRAPKKGGKLVFTEDLGYSTEDKLYARASALVRSATAQKEAFMIMDALLGPVAMLVGGPQAYLQKKHNPTTVPEKAVTRYSDSNDWHEAALSYQGLSNFWLKHPAIMSMVLGVSRHALELWCDGKYESVDEKIDIEYVRDLLTGLQKKKKLTLSNKRSLLEVIKWAKPLFSSKKVMSNLGAYPINPYTWGMFLKFVKFNFDGLTLREAWGGDSIYNQEDYGFYTWCAKQKKQTKKFKGRPKGNVWSGLTGTQISL